MLILRIIFHAIKAHLDVISALNNRNVQYIPLNLCRAHDANLISLAKKYLAEHDTQASKIKNV